MSKMFPPFLYILSGDKAARLELLQNRLLNKLDENYKIRWSPGLFVFSTQKSMLIDKQMTSSDYHNNSVNSAPECTRMTECCIMGTPPDLNCVWCKDLRLNNSNLVMMFHWSQRSHFIPRGDLAQEAHCLTPSHTLIWYHSRLFCINVM